MVTFHFPLAGKKKKKRNQIKEKKKEEKEREIFLWSLASTTPGGLFPRFIDSSSIWLFPRRHSLRRTYRLLRIFLGDLVLYFMVIFSPQRARDEKEFNSMTRAAPFDWANDNLLVFFHPSIVFDAHCLLHLFFSTVSAYWARKKRRGHSGSIGAPSIRSLSLSYTLFLGDVMRGKRERNIRWNLAVVRSRVSWRHQFNMKAFYFHLGPSSVATNDWAVRAR